MIITSFNPDSPASPTASPDHPVIGWHNLVTISNLSAETEDGDFPAVNMANPSTALRWKGDDGFAQSISITTGYLDQIDYIGIVGHNFGSAGYKISVEGSSVIDSPFEIDLFTLEEIDDDLPLILRFQPQVLAALRITLVPNDSPNAEVPTIAAIYVGKLLVVQRKIYVGHTPLPMGRNTNVVNGRSESGNFLGRIVVGQSRDTAVDLQNLKPDWYRTYFDPFIEASKEAPFFFAWRPDSYPLETGYAWLTNDPKPVNSLPNGMMSIQLQMGGVAA